MTPEASVFMFILFVVWSVLCGFAGWVLRDFRAHTDALIRELERRQ